VEWELGWIWDEEYFCVSYIRDYSIYPVAPIEK
jgi:hypothetical protein